MRKIHQLKLAVFALFVVAGATLLVTNNFTNRTVHAFSSGPPAGYTRAPGEEPDACRECHLPPSDSGAGRIQINTPQTYAPGQTYQISVVHTNADQTRRRWGFQLTALDDTNTRAGTLSTLGDGRTQVLDNQGPFPTRQYIEHTSLGTFDGQTGSATWTFNWTAPSEDVGPVTFYAAGNHANGNGNSDGDQIYFTFATISPAAAAGDFTINITPATQTIIPGSSGSYTITVTPSNNFTGTVDLSLTGQPEIAIATFAPASIQITDASPRSATLNISVGAKASLGNFTLNVTGTSGNLQRTATATLVTGPSMLDAGLTVRRVMGGLNQPTGLAIDHRGFFVLEKATGKVIRNDFVLTPGTVLDLAVNSASERGLLGIALHPQFPANPRVYLFWTESSTGADTSNPDEVSLLGNRVDSFIWDGAKLTHERNLIRLRALQQDAGQPSRGNHNGGIIRFGHDGKLYIVMGDNGRRGLLQNLPFGPSVSPQGPTVADDQFGGPEPDDAHLAGVILRLNDDGTTPNDNPFFNAQTNLTGEAAANLKKVFAYGIRNSFGMAFDPVSGQLWTQENGDDSFDEINRVVPGFNGGWIQLMGPSARVAEFKAIELGRSGGLQQLRWPPERIADTPAEARARLAQLPGAIYTEPEFSWKYAVAPSSLGFVAGRALGPQNEGALIVGASRTTLAGGYLFRFKLASDRRKLSLSDARLAVDLVADNADKFDATESESLLFGRDFGITTDIQTDSLGNLYVVSLSDGAIYIISPKPNTVQFSTEQIQVTETNASIAVEVTRSGDTSGTAAVEYHTVDDPAAVPCDPSVRQPNGEPYPQGTAYARCDYATVAGTLTFAPGEMTKTFTVPLIDDAHAEPNETFQLELGDPAGATSSTPSAPRTTVTIIDNDSANAPNPIYESFRTPFFVRQQYLDFLSREPDPAGLAAWLRVLRECSDVNNNPACDRITVSSSFFRSIEFQLKGYFVYLFYKVSLGRIPRYAEIIPDMASVTGATAEEVFAKRDAFANNWLTRTEFKTLYPETLTPTAYVDRLLQTAGVTLSGTTTRETLIADLQAGRRTRAEVLRAIVEHPSVEAKEFNEAFVAMQYFGYLRRDPDPEGYRNWLNYLKANPNDFRTMVRGFLYSTEYFLRFGKV
ncbi:MAG TPA: PQQ-dependent sugar dehydrogenase [Pyrinomonadaceae bacterium]|nr:PQQ-dependent sugar dehydrogenase [Pyrinomonadaceae bacterium]